MLTLILFLVVGFLIGAAIHLVGAYKEYKEIELDDVAVSILFGLVGICIGLTLSLIVGYSIKPEYKTFIDSVEIVALADNPTVKGRSYFLGSGHFNGSMQYVCYYKVEDELQMLMVDYKGTRIRFEDSEPRLETEYKYHTNKFSYRDQTILVKRTFVVPEGTVQNGYNLDAQ